MGKNVGYPDSIFNETYMNSLYKDVRAFLLLLLMLLWKNYFATFFKYELNASDYVENMMAISKLVSVNSFRKLNTSVDRKS